ncbi:MAG TPA: GDCCVxC domain-containing (seleno)protein [Longimicrobiales bacterium]|nr:GDCCVxC domain-containing (seleno)protein [Longimicrobiales bacterium]
MTTPTIESLLRCPECGHAERLAMPSDACVYFHACSGCGVVLRPKAGDCCVFCSYGSVPCPPIQAAKHGAGGCRPAVPGAQD